MKFQLKLKVAIALIGSLPTILLSQDGNININLDEIPTDEIVPVRVINDQGEPLPSNLYSNITYDIYENKIYLANIDQIIVLGPERKVNSTVGRKGKGPGEFGQIVRIVVDRERIFIADYKNARITILKKDFSYVRSVPVNGSIRDMAFIGDNQLIVHTAASTGFKLHRYDIEVPLRPIDSFLEVIKKFEGISGNVRTINIVYLAANSNCLYVLYKSLPILQFFCGKTNEYQEIRFSGEIVDNLYEKVPSRIQTSAGATPVKVFALRILITNCSIYWLTASGKQKKLFQFDQSLKKMRAYSLELPQDVKAKKYYQDFCINNNKVYVLNTANGTIQVYQINP